MKKIFYLLLPVSMAVFLFLIWLFFSYFRIKKVIIISPDKDIYGLSAFSNRNYFFIDLNGNVTILKQKNYFYKNIKISKRFPDTVLLNFQSPPPFARVTSGEKVYLVDEAGFPVKSYQNNVTGLYDISLPSMIINSRSADWRIVKALTLLHNLNKYGLQFSDIVINNDSTEIRGKLDESTITIIAINKDQNEVAASLQTIISRFRIEGKNISSIDYRFDKPVVVLKNE